MTQDLLYVRRQWNDTQRVASVPLDCLEKPHWTDISSGVGARAPQEFIHGYIMCDEIVEGGVAHSCKHGPAPHRIKVCVVQKDNEKATFAKLRVATRGGPPISRRRRAGAQGQDGPG